MLSKTAMLFFHTLILISYLSKSIISKQLTFTSAQNTKKVANLQNQIRSLKMMSSIHHMTSYGSDLFLSITPNETSKHHQQHGHKLNEFEKALNNLHTKKIENSKEYISQIKYSELGFSEEMQRSCQIPLPFSKATSFLFQTPRSSYIIVNNPLASSISFFITSLCLQISSVQSHQIMQLYCDRGLCDDGSVVGLTKEHKIIVCTQSRNFSDCRITAEINGLIRGHIVGGVVRSKTSGGGNMQIYLADSAGDIIVIDGQGKHKLSVTMEPDSQIRHFVDIHPYPIIVSSKNWIYVFQNTKYIISLTKCAYMHQEIEKIYVSHQYQSSFYVISKDAITKIQIKNGNKACQVGDRLYYGSYGQLNFERKESCQDSQMSQQDIAQFRNRLYIGNYVVNIKQKQIKQFSECGRDASFNFQLMKNNYRKGLILIKCSQEAESSSSELIVFRQKSSQQTSTKINTIVIIIILFLVMLLVFLFLRSTTPNLDYDEQLRYDSNKMYKREVENFLKKKAEKSANDKLEESQPKHKSQQKVAQKDQIQLKKQK